MYYFAYGSNLSQKLFKECCPNGVPRFTAELPNYKLIFTGWSRPWRGALASIKRSGRDKVLGAIYEIDENDLPKLDRAEDCPASYQRLPVIVFRDTGQSVEAVTYIKTRQADEAKPSPEYLKVLQQGYRDWGLI